MKRTKLKYALAIMDVDLRFAGHINSCIKNTFANLKLICNYVNMLCDSLVLSQLTCDLVYELCLLDQIQSAFNLYNAITSV